MERDITRSRRSLLFLLVLITLLPLAIGHAQVPEWEFHEGENTATRFISLYPSADGGLLVAAIGTFPINDNDTISLFQLLRFSSDGDLLWRQTPVTDRTVTPINAVETESGWIVIGRAAGVAEAGVTLWRGEIDHGGELVEDHFFLSPRFDSFVGAVREEGTILIAGSPLSGSRDVIVGHVPTGSAQVFRHDYRPGRGETHVAFLRPLDRNSWMAFGESYDSLLQDLRAFAWRLAPDGRSREFIRIPWLHRAEVHSIAGCDGGGYALGVGILPDPGSTPAPHLLRANPSGDKLTLHQLRAEVGSRLLPVGCDQSQTIALLLNSVESRLIRIDLAGRIADSAVMSLEGNFNDYCSAVPAADEHAFYVISTLDGRGWLGRFRVHVSSVESGGEGIPEDLDLSLVR